MILSSIAIVKGQNTAHDVRLLGEVLMKTSGILITAASAFLTFVSVASADQYVNGYYRKDGTYVQPYHRSDADGNPFNNYSTRGNVNPYTGQPGTKNPYSNPYSSSYGNPDSQSQPQNPYDPN